MKFFPIWTKIAILVTVLLIAGCDKKEETPAPEPEFSSIIENYDFNADAFGVADTAKIEFTSEFDGFGNLIQTKDGLYQLRLLSLSLGAVQLDTLWQGPRTLYIWSTELLPASQELELNLELEWLDRATDVSYNTVEELTITTTAGSLPADEIIASYPVDRQYYFLKGEYDKGFVVVDRQPADVSDLSVSFINDSESVIFESSVSKSENGRRLDFDLPDFESEKVYRLELRDAGNLLRMVDFRTSKYNTLSEKLGNLVQNPEATRQIHILWQQFFLWQDATISEEGFDRAEANFGTETVEGGSDYNYCNGLVQLEFNPEGNPWYEEWLYPIVYASFPDPDFTAEPAHHPNLGERSFLAMHFSFDDELPYLQDSQLLAENTPANFESDFAILNYVTSAALYDFESVQAAVVDEYINDETYDDRVADIIWAQYAVPGAGNYKFNMNYRLPDGTVTSTLTFDMEVGE